VDSDTIKSAEKILKDEKKWKSVNIYTKKSGDKCYNYCTL
jgi:hypothetical protein